MVELKNRKICTKIMTILKWSDYGTKTSTTKKLLDCSWKAISNLQSKISDKKNMSKLALQNDQICILKSHKFESSIKNTVIKSTKTWNQFTTTFWVIQNALFRWLFLGFQVLFNHLFFIFLSTSCTKINRVTSQSVLYHQKMHCNCHFIFFVLFTWWFWYLVEKFIQLFHAIRFLNHERYHWLFARAYHHLTFELYLEFLLNLTSGYFHQFQQIFSNSVCCIFFVIIHDFYQCISVILMLFQKCITNKQLVRVTLCFSCCQLVILVL